MQEKTKERIENARINLKIALSIGDLSASEVSIRAGLSVNVVGKYLRGETMISFSNMQAVCDELDIPMALITSGRQITPARIRLARALERMSEDDLAEFIKSEAARERQA